jgi:hypothetical protein
MDIQVKFHFLFHLDYAIILTQKNASVRNMVFKEDPEKLEKEFGGKEKKIVDSDESDFEKNAPSEDEHED